MHDTAAVDAAGPRADEWSDWLLHRRHGDNSDYQAVVQAVVERVADRVLDDARLLPGMTLLDIGAGDGLLAFRAIGRMGGEIRAVLTDISAPLLRHAETSAARGGIQDRCTFAQCSAEKLSAIADSTIDSIVTRASIAYVFDKKAAFSEFRRVLKPGGSISMAEPILQDEAFASRALRKHVESPSAAPGDHFVRLLHRCKAAQYPDTEEGYANNPLVNFSERDLLNHLRGAGFIDIHLELHIDVAPALIRSWDVFLDASPHPWAPPLRKILAEQFSPEERRLFEERVRPGVESGKNIAVERIVFVNARKPANP